MARSRLFRILPASIFSLAVVSLGAFAACGDDATGMPTATPVADGATTPDGGAGDDAGGDGNGDDGAVTSDGASDAKTDGTSAKDTTPPAKIALSATSESVSSIKLSWTAVGDDGLTGIAAGYEIRRSLAPITTLAELAAATLVPSPPAPSASGTAQSVVVTGLAAGTAYHFAIRARDEVPNQGEISGDATASTLPRAKLLISEVAVSNAAADGSDFVELVAVTGGRVDGLVLRESSGGLYTFGALAVAAGDRIVVHAGGACVAADAGATCQNEDAPGATAASSTEPFATAAWDVYATSSGLSAADNVVSIKDGTTILDAIALSSRDGDTSATNMTAFADLATANAWTFGAAPVDGTNDCATQKDTVSVATAVTTCGGQPTAGAGISVQRAGTADTNGKKDFYSAPQTRGLANGLNAAPTVVSASGSAATGVRIVFNEDIDAASALPASFTIAGLGISAAASLSDVNEITIVTAPQAAGQSYTLTLAPGVNDLQGTVGGAGSYGFCGFSASPVAMVINEVAPNIAASRDLVELRVTNGGAVSGITLRANPTVTGGGTLLATLPNVCGATGDLFVVHLSPDATTGESETTGKAQFGAATFSGNYDGAWDVKGSNNGISATTEAVLAIFGVKPAAANPPILDAVAFTSDSAAACAISGTCTTGVAFKAALDVIEAGAQWTPACGATPCNDTTAPTAIGVSASFAGTGPTPGSLTVARKNTDANSAADWAVAASSLGLNNP